MPYHQLFQYQIKTEPVLASDEVVMESKWHQPLSLPVRYVISKRLAIALSASGMFSPIFEDSIEPGASNVGPWIYPWSEPRRYKRGLNTALQEPIALRVPIIPNTATLLLGYNWWSVPKRYKRGIRADEQQALAQPPRILPNPNVTMIMDATEDNQDVALFALNVYNSGGSGTGGVASAQVSITEVQRDDSAALSIAE